MSKPDPKLTSVAEWGRSIGISRQAAHAAVKRHGIPLIDGKVDPVAATAIYRAKCKPHVRAEPSKQLQQSEGFGVAAAATAEQVEDLRHWRARDARASALLKENALAIDSDKYVEFEPLLKQIENLVWVFRQQLLSIPSRLAQEVAGDHAHRVEVNEAASRLIEQALQELHAGPNVLRETHEQAKDSDRRA